MMSIVYNGTAQEVEEAIPLHLHLTNEGLADQSGIAVAVNETVIPKKDWPNQILQPQDKILVIKATQGG